MRSRGVVRQQNRPASDALGEPARAGDLFNTTHAAGDNYLALKLSYWPPSKRGDRRPNCATRKPLRHKPLET